MNHVSRLRGGRHRNAALQADFDALGEAAFKFEVLEVIERKGDRLNAEEELIAKHFDHGQLCYNAKIKAVPYTLGVKRGPHSEEHKAKIGAAQLGKKVSDETKTKLRAANLGKKASEETRAKLRAANLGKKHSKETCDKIGAIHRGKKLSDETKAKLRAAKLGRKHSAESRAKMSASQFGRKHSDETRAKISAALKAHFSCGSVS